mgnify:CR=1 FL=1
MTPDALRVLIRGGETLAVEFKGEERTPLNDRDLVEAVLPPTVMLPRNS